MVGRSARARGCALALAVALTGAGHAQTVAPAEPASAAAARLRTDDEWSGSFGKAIVATLLVVGAAFGLASVARKRGLVVSGGTRQARLRAVAHLRLGPKCTLHLVEADGQAVLVASGEQARLLPLKAASAEEGAAS